ncbi:putative metallodependent hydrolase [Candidatus Terasakiella magnetica]|uniref:Putative metallodependent hydrolase n=1 Tax=Candidatus Terasakiella magnetica TaxID=1867952 RepID=A0A1C3RD51_9PROT|nr:TatD family hydrolase [Candidatus Terasakiella magnetica]SCA55182.1 putative metallodependent hydrolase [Candidatus Terasakiella magnetica]
MLVDTHCHLDFPDFEEDFDQVLANAKEAGVDTMVTICTYVTRFEQVLNIAKAHDHIYCTVGIHPHNAASEPEVSVKDLCAMAADDKVIGFGETGLDYFYEHSPRDIQQRQFRTHIQAARELDLPVIIHTREAEEDTLALIEEEMAHEPFTGLIHCFSASKAFADRVVELGLYISISGIVTFKKADELREAISDVPLDRLLVETDAPYLSPIPKRGKRNEPAYTAFTAAKVAEVKGVSEEEFAKASTDNFYRLFSKTKRG